MRGLLLLLALLLTSCAYGSRFNIIVDPAFTADQEAEVRAGVKMWEDAIPEMRTEQYMDELFIYPKENCPFGWTPGVLGVEKSTSICIDVARSGSRLPQVAAHETGHALGLPHLPPPSIMATHDDGTIAAPTSSDVAALRKILGL